MSKQDNLTDFLTDVADAIREKKGTTEKINPQNFSDEIRGIESGGGNIVSSEMIDIEGTGLTRVSSVIIRDGVTNIADYAYSYCRSLLDVIIPNGVESIGKEAFSYCPMLPKLYLPSTLTVLGDKVFAQSLEIEVIDIPISAPINNLPRNMFWSNRKMAKFVVPSNIQLISEYAFEGCTALVYIDFRSVASTPQLSNSNAFDKTTCKIVVPDTLYDEWIAATNWSIFASRIVKASEFVEPTNE